MLSDIFLGKRPSHFKINSIVKAYIISELFLWSAWDFVMPIFALFVVTDIARANIETAAFGYSIYLISRVLFELISGRYLYKTGDRKKLLIAIVGIFCLSIAYIGFSISNSIIMLFSFYFILGMGLGIASPAKNAIFSIHLDKNKESTEWGITDAASFICMAMATALGGFFAHQFGFRPLFLLAAIINLFSIIPYALHLWMKQ
jgi:MFS family permease